MSWRARLWGHVLAAVLSLLLVGLVALVVVVVVLVLEGCSTLAVTHHRKADRHSGLVVVEVGMGQHARVAIGDERCDAGVPMVDAGIVPDAAQTDVDVAPDPAR